ncbi:MAG TPA: glycerophosphodiester phosphodiesterase family protein, partial [Thermoanaerobaculia bacterium]|nr:glycerophosphodiester phosphodiesterase family protein [Thermoanaerobaculia bacterium]
MAAFRRALRERADLLETDLHLTRDDVFVCLHDATLLRTGGVPAAAADLTFAALRRHPVACGRREFEAERVPALEELLEILPADVGLLLELKTDRFLEPAVGRRLGDLLRAAGAADRTAVLSFEFERCRAVRREVPEVRAGYVTNTGGLPPAGGAQMGGAERA